MARRKRIGPGEWRKALQALASEAPPAALVVHGGQSWFRAETVETLLSALRRDRPDAGVSVYQGPASPSEAGLPLETVLGELTSHGLFATEKTVVVRRADRFLFPGGGGDGGREDGLAAWLADPAPGMRLVLECERIDRRTRRGKALVKHARLFECPELRYERDTLVWLRQYAAGRALDLTPDAARMLFVLHGAEPGVLAGELEKLALFAGGAQVDESAVRAFMGDDAALGFFDLSNALEEKDLDTAMTLTRRMLRQGLSDARGRKVDLVGVVHMAMGSLRNTLTTLWQAHDVAARGGGPDDLAPRLGARAWRAEALLAAGRRYSAAEIRRGFDALADALARMHDTGGDPALGLERTVLAVCGGAAEPSRERKETR